MKRYLFLSDSHQLLTATQGGPNIEADPTLQMGCRMDLKTKNRKENLKGFLSSHDVEWSKCPAKKALIASLGHKGTKPLIISTLLGFCRC